MSSDLCRKDREPNERNDDQGLLHGRPIESRGETMKEQISFDNATCLYHLWESMAVTGEELASVNSNPSVTVVRIIDKTPPRRVSASN